MADRRQRWLKPVSLRARWASLSLLAIAPLMLVTFLNADRDRASAMSERGENLANLARLAAAAYQQSSDAALEALGSIQDEAGVLQNEQPFCNRLLERMGATHPSFSAFSVAGTDGIVRCSGQENLLGASVVDRAYFQDVLADRSLAVSGFLISRPANIPIIVYALPFFEEHERLSGILILSLELSWFETLAKSLALPEDTRITVMDRAGTVLVRYPADNLAVGEPAGFDQVGDALQQGRSGYRNFTQSSGDPVIIGFDVIRGPDGAVAGMVTVGERSTGATAAASATFRRALLTILIVTGAAMGLTWVGMTYTVQRPLHELVGATRRFAAGSGHVPVRLSRLNAPEVIELSQSFDSMAAAVTEGQETLRRLATIDATTELPNRGELERRANTLLYIQQERPPTILVTGFRDFSLVNSTFGYEGGDEVLRQVGPRLRTEVPGIDIGRIGDAQFGILIPHLVSTGPDEAVRRLGEAMKRPFTIHGEPVSLAAGGGVAVGLEDADDGALLLRRAQLAARTAMRTGEPALRFDHDRDEPRNQVQMLSALRLALANDGLQLWYQPKVDLRLHRVVGVEALMRWQTADGAFVPPSEFIPLAERAGLITSITEWAIDQAARQSAAWRSRGTFLPVAVNASARDLTDPRFPEMLAAALQRWGVPGEAIDIEITETDLMTGLEDAERNCATIKEMGVGISIDDFGTGYSPLVYLHRLPVTSLKIDRSFIQGIMHGDDVRGIIHSVTELAHRLRITVTAEGIEEEAELDILRSLGCDVGQGYYFSRALPPGELETWSAQMDGREQSQGRA